jgi:hypothetical protein
MTRELTGEHSGTMHVALYVVNGKTVGLLVGPAVDIVQHSLKVRGKAHRRYVQFTTMIDGQLVEFLDVDGIIGSVESDGAGEDAVASEGE